ncbi:MAG: gliding motility-associated C-terminal domain-containing protein [Chitinophagales bacterium]
MRKKPVAFIVLLFFAKLLPAQTCTNVGQTPSSAILLCGTTSYFQNNVPMCGQLAIPTPCPATSTYQNTNPFWFRLACFSSGTLAFTIIPNDPVDNFDWQLFDVTGRNDDDVMSDPSLFVACNWCPDAGLTGASVDGNRLTVCAETSAELYSSMPVIVQGHEYLLLVVHRNANQLGFQIVVSGGSASVTDPVEPALFSARLSCNSTQILVYLNKEMFCTTIAPDGSDFVLSNGAAITSASYSCTVGKTGLVTLSLSNSLPPGNYSVKMKDGSDGNTLTDRCNRQIPVGDSIAVALPSNVPTSMDSLTTPGCSPEVLRLVFRQPIQCNSVALNGSDFSIVGPQPVSINNVAISCNTQTVTTMAVTLGLTSPIISGGAYEIFLRTGTDGNTLVDECGGPVLASSIRFSVEPSVSAAFTYSIKASCKEDTIYFSNSSTGVATWSWKFDNIPGTNAPDQIKIYPATGQHVAQLIVSNGNCKDTASESITLDNKVVAAFELPGSICPEDEVKLINSSTGTVDQWKWELGNNVISNLQTPQPFHYPITGIDAIYMVKLIAANNSMNCKDSALKRIRVFGNCYIAVPTAFTPNGDGLNDYLNPNNAVKADNLLFRVYNRLGQLVFETKDWTRKWDGKVKGEMQQTGVYAWMLTYTHHDTGEKVFQKGTTVLIR